MRIEKHVEIDRPPEEVFSFIADASNDPVWCASVSESTQIEGDGPEPGAVYMQMHKPGPGKPTELRVELGEMEPPRRLELKSIDHLGWFDVRYELERLPGDRTRLTQIDETHFQGFARLLTPVMWLAINRGVQGQFQHLKRLLEREDAADPRR